MLPWGVLTEGATGGIPSSQDAASYNNPSKFEFFADPNDMYDSTLFPDPVGIPHVVVVDTRDMTIRHKHFGNDVDAILAAVDEILEQ